MRGESLTSPRRINAKERALKAVELRKAGATYQAIADQLGFRSPQGAYDAVKRTLLRTAQAPSDELRVLEIERLDTMLLAIWAAVRAGNYGAIDRAIRIAARRAALLGLDAPDKHEVTGADGEPLFQDVSGVDFDKL